MLTLGIETSSRLGSVALVEDGKLLSQATHDTPNAHGEKLLGLIDGLFLETARSPRELTTVAVGRGPGAFTGLRIGLSLAQGIAQGLGIPAVGVGSLQAMALGLAGFSEHPRLTLLDARRGELFLACYRDNGDCLIPPRTIPREGFWEALKEEALPPDGAFANIIAEKCCLIGAVLGELSPTESTHAWLTEHNVLLHRSPMTDYPSAVAVATFACIHPDLGPATPDYLRDADAIKPVLPPCPLDMPRP